MATTKLTGTINHEKQGWYSSTYAKKGTNETIKITFPSFTDAKNYTFQKALLYMTFKNSGNDGKKKMKITSTGIEKQYITNGDAYAATTYIDFGNNLAALQQWFANGGTVITSTDPESGGYHTLSSGTCSYNYAKISAAYWEIEYVAKASSLSSYTSSMSLGTAYSTTISASDSSYTHDIIITCGSASATFSALGNGTTSVTPPLSLGSGFPSSTSSAATLTLITKSNGSEIGRNSYSITLSTSNKPTITGVSVSPTSSILGGITSLTITANGVAGTAGASIKSYALSIGGVSCGSNTTGKFTVVPSNNLAGSKTATIVVTDSRNYTSSKESGSFTIYSYAAPYLSGLSFYRCNENGTRDDVSGTSAAATFTSHYSAAASNAIKSLTLTINGTTYSSYSSGTVIEKSKLKVDTQYAATIKITDNMGYSSTYNLVLPSATYLLHFREGQNSVGIGCAADDVGSGSRIKVGWPLVVNNTITLNSALPLASGGTGISATSNAGLLESLGAVKKSGDTMTGALNLNNNLTVSGVSTFGGKSVIKNDATFPQMLFKVSGDDTTRSMLFWNENGKQLQFRHFNGADAYEDFRLPAVTTSSTAYYDILTTKNLLNTTISGTDPVNYQINLGEARIEAGFLDLTDATSNAVTTTTVSFESSFSSIPIVVGCFQSSSSAAAHAAVDYSISNRSTTGFTVRVYNNSSTGRAPNFLWIAIGK